MRRLVLLIAFAVITGALISFGIVDVLNIIDGDPYEDGLTWEDHLYDGANDQSLITGTAFVAPESGAYEFTKAIAEKEDALNLQLRHIEVVFSETKMINRFKTAVASSTSRSSGYRRYLTVDLTLPSGITAEQYKKVIGHTGLNPIIDIAVAMEKQIGVNSLYILAHAAEESKWGKSEIAAKKNNFFGYNAVDSNPSKAFSYISPEACVKSVMTQIKKSYLTKGGKFYSRKNGATLLGMSARYASNPLWDENIASIMNKIHGAVDKQN